MRTLYAYLYCNIGGVSTVLGERVKADANNEFVAVFKSEAGGKTPLQALGVDVEIADDYINRALQISKREQLKAIHLIDEACQVERIREAYDGVLILEVHSSTSAYLDQISDDRVAAVDAVFTPSAWSRNQIINRLVDAELANKVHIVPNIALSPKAMQSSTDKLVERPSFAKPPILWVGKLSGGKNWRDALQICHAVSSEIDVSTVFVTGGELSKDTVAAFLSEIQTLGLDIDWRHNLPRSTISALYQAASSAGGVLLATTLAESYGLVVVESLAHGLPVVASGVGALPELIEPGINGFTFPPGNTDRPTRYVVQILSGQAQLDTNRLSKSIPSTCEPENNHKLIETILASIDKMPTIECRLTEFKHFDIDEFNPATDYSERS